MQSDRQENRKSTEKRNTFWTRSADVLGDFAYRYRSFLRTALTGFFIFYLLVASVFLGVRYLVLPHVSAYKSELETLASESIGRPVTFSRVSASWYGLQPKIDLENVRVADSNGNEVVRLENVSAIVSWWSLPLMDVRLASLQIDRPDITVMRDKQGRFHVAGVLVDPAAQNENSIADWILKQHEIVLSDGVLHWKDEFRNGAELNLEQVDFAMKNRGRRHKFRMTAVPDSQLTGSLDIRGNLLHPRFADKISDISRWKGELYVDMSGVDMAEWKRLADFPIGLISGRGAVQAWLTLDEFQLTGLTADIDGEDIRLKMEATLPQLDLLKASGRLSIQKTGRPPLVKGAEAKPVYSYSASHLSLETLNRKKLDDASFSVTYVPGEANAPDEAMVEAERLDVGELKAFLPYLPLDEDIRRQIDKYDFSGRVSNFFLDWKKTSAEKSSYLIKGHFDGLTFMEKPGNEETRLKKTPALMSAISANLGFENLTGSISVNEYGGNLELDSRHSALVLPLYPKTLPQKFDELKARLQWKRSHENVLAVEVEELSFLQRGMRADVSGRYTNSLDDKTNRYGSLDLSAKIQNLDIADVKKYIPLQTPETLHQWLFGALKGGRVSEGMIQIKGDLADFPYASGKTEGLFTVQAKLVDGALNYAPTLLSPDGRRPLWPVIEKIQGQFQMNGALLAIHADKALTNNVELKNVEVVIPDVLANNPLLEVKGDADGTLQNLVGFVNVTPVSDWIGHLTEKTVASGNAALALKLQLPIERLESSTVAGTLRFNDNDIVLLEDLPVIAKTQGQLHFSEKGFRLEKIKASFLNEPVTVSGGTLAGGRFLVRADGVLSARGLQRTYATGMMGKMMEKLAGSSPYVVNVSDSEIRIDSGLKGLKIGLPAPLGKQAISTVPLKIVLKDRPASGNILRDELDIAYGDNMSARYMRQKTKQGNWRVVRGNIGINKSMEPKEGLSLDLSLHNIDFNEWSDVLKDFYSVGGESAPASSGSDGLAQYLYPDHFSVDADEMTAMDLWLTNARLDGTRQSGRWDIAIRSDQMNGQLKWIEGSGKTEEGKLVARLKSLNILQSSLKKVSDMTGREDIYRIPALDIVTDDLVLFGIHLGKTEIVANNVSFKDGREWRINRLKIANPDAVLESSGSWITSAENRQQTKLNYVLNIKNAGKLLTRFGYNDLIRGGHGEMKGDISWDGLPFALDIPSLSGKLSLKVESGQFLKADPGAAKLLSVISLQSLPRRLNLDFRDVFSKGFAFDEITANARIANGIMTTENLKMNGVNAAVLMDGSVNIGEESQNLHVVVIPEINAAAASIAYGFVNPAIGIGTFLAQMFLREPLMKQFTHEYRVTGSWNDPSIQEIKSGS
ncbi:YhdP family protein [Oxalobacter paraformigenes]|uniref:TIGR02099 family protein n=1 Tax=Oxalobacter paraformigenes TaxID=556268 RepID=C3X5K0_9BURK|nr:YhdP family protein [Oxalobacter paraformigenes]EEO28486.2 TIGR02099 family protein [Oxalobacter paraformigenes]